ncbi:ribosome-dependent ATPase [Rhodovulum iodosum]|uniref:Ribosome-dependent ATPase n=1 Tax=Rhodovulum iodosum TaxID=68291 RepID=A0ABV3XX14_9RHOB|nr:ribosome-associated ATPase/putative transporter RbbA [Rhodovulum robiginosum]RSK34052.1 ABC transporter ATP-binding protein/permease [Rhodovulum robiginosum]
MAAEPVAEAAGLSHRYGAKAALSDVSLTLPAGRMVGLIGPDGVGKSTLLGLLAGVRRLQAGRLQVLGGDIAEAAHRRAVLPRIAYMPQGLGRNLYPTLSVRENLDFFGRLFGQGPDERAWRIDELLAGTGLSPFPDRPAGQLSGGMKQKLALCCALIHDPDLLVLDEPTTGVDPLSRRQFWDLIARIRARRPGMSVATATAYMSEAEGFEHLIAMDAGRVLASGGPADIKSQTGADTLEAAFIALLPEDRRDGHQGVVLPPRPSDGHVPAIEAEGLTKRFGDFTAVDHVDFRIEKGEIFGFLGSNGCGKTTTMKMLTGLLHPSEGRARLFGKPVKSGDLSIRRRVGYMSQSFSLYSELTVRQNLMLHAQLFQLATAERAPRVAELLDRFDLVGVAHQRAPNLPLGVRQRLQLAVAVLHRPEMLILDEPTSGVDPVARDRFWELLIELSRRDGVTIFISTHFMNEAERCDRISLMHAGRVLAMGPPGRLCEEIGVPSLEEAFIAHLEKEAEDAAPEPDVPRTAADTARRPARAVFSPSRAWAFARREATELMRDRIRLAFALIGPMVLMLAMGYGISFDVENLRYGVLDQDQSRESRGFLRQLSSSRYFDEQAPIASLSAVDTRLKRGDMTMAVIVPPGFGRDLLAARGPEVAIWLDGANTVRAETARRYAEAAFQDFLIELSQDETGITPRPSAAEIAPRFRYNQAFVSAQAIPPGVLMLMLMMIPTMMTALSIVREKEIGSITNFSAAPVGKMEFLTGKQLPYVAVAMVSFALLLAMLGAVFGLGIKGDPLALVAGVALYVTAATGFGLVISSFVRSQIAAIFGSAIIVVIPAVNFSGMLYPVATMQGPAAIVGHAFPTLYFQRISTGVFNKGLGLGDLWTNHLVLFGFCAVFWALAAVLLRKQEA